MARGIANAALESLGRDRRPAIDNAVIGAIADTRRRRPTASYSRFVALMKLVLPVIAGILVTMVVLWPELNDRPAKFQLGVARLNIGDAERQQVINARYTGVDGRNNPYSVTADELSQNPENEDLVDLKNPKADVTLSGGSWLAIMSPTGEYSKATQVLELSGGVNAFHDLGYEFRTERAIVDFQNRSAFGDSAVNGQGPFGELQSEGFLVLDSGTSILFTGRARLLLYPDKRGGAK
jgi:lipopolysaccharide export system protein LptC